MRSRGGVWGVVALGLGLALSSACGSTFKGEAGSAGRAGAGSAHEAGSSFSGSANAGSGNNAGSAGALQGGTSGAVGGAPSAGGAGTPASGYGPGGAETTAGSAGDAAGGGGPDLALDECATDADCQVVDDCCTCAAQPKSAQIPPCAGICIQSACQARGLQAAKAACVANRCVFDVSCDQSLVTCEAVTPTCPVGQEPSVSGTCWGPCVPTQDCKAVTNCNACAAGQICVRNELQMPSTHCVEAPPSCAQHPTCECTNACNLQCSDDNGISCFCVSC